MESNGNTPGSSSTPSEAQERHNEFWPKQMELIRNMKNTDFKTQELPLARIKKIMKLDDDVKMISAEAPVLFSKAAEIFIAELSLRAWLHTEENKRRTLQRNDIAMAVSKYDQFDFLIDIVPRDELKPPKRQEGQVQQATMMPDQVQYYFQLAQNQQGTQQTTAATPTVAAAANTGQTAGQPGQILVTTPGGQQQYITIAAPNQVSTTGQTQQEGQVQQATMMSDQVQYILAQNQQGTQQTTQQQTTTTPTVAAANAGQTAAQPGQILVTTPGGQQQYITIAAPNQVSTSGQTQQVQTVTVSNNDNQVQLLTNQGNQSSAALVPVQLQAAQGTNIQQLVTNTGEMQQVQFSPQIQYVRPAQGGQQGNQTELGQTVYQIQQLPIQNQSGQVTTQQVFLQQAAGGDATTATTQVQLTEQT